MLHIPKEQKYSIPLPRVVKVFVGANAQSGTYCEVDRPTLMELLKTAFEMLAQVPFRRCQLKGYSHQKRPFNAQELKAVQVLGLDLQANSCDAGRAASATVWRQSSPALAQAPFKAAMEVLTVCEQYVSHCQNDAQSLLQLVQENEWALNKLGIAIEIRPGQEMPIDQDVGAVSSSGGASTTLEAVTPGDPKRTLACPSVNESAAFAEEEPATSVGRGINNPGLKSALPKKMWNAETIDISALPPGQIPYAPRLAHPLDAGCVDWRRHRQEENHLKRLHHHAPG